MQLPAICANHEMVAYKYHNLKGQGTQYIAVGLQPETIVIEYVVIA